MTWREFEQRSPNLAAFGHQRLNDQLARGVPMGVQPNRAEVLSTHYFRMTGVPGSSVPLVEVQVVVARPDGQHVLSVDL
jgi:hypothetical protein